MTREEAISIAREFLLERHKNDVHEVASIMKASTDKPKLLAHYLRQHIEFLTKLANIIEKTNEQHS